MSQHLTQNRLTEGEQSKVDLPSFTAEQIADLCEEQGFNGFTADHCGQCRTTVNVLNNRCGWFCPCGHFNLLSWSGGFQLPHEAPQHGPSAAVLREGVDLFHVRIAALVRDQMPGAPQFDFKTAAGSLIENDLCQKLAVRYGLPAWSSWGKVLAYSRRTTPAAKG